MPLPISGVPHSIATSPLKVTGYDVQADGLASPPTALKSFYVEKFSLLAIEICLASQADFSVALVHESELARLRPN